MQAGTKSASLWIEGPAGSGKTTLVNGFLDSEKASSIWYRFDERDAEPETFFHHLSRAVGSEESKHNLALPVPSSECESDILDFARSYFSDFYRNIQKSKPARTQGNKYIVFDDCHLVPKESQLHHIAKIALSELAGDLRLIFISRSSIPPALASKLASRRLAVIGWDDIRLDMDETTEIIKLLHAGQEISNEFSNALYQTTQGWIAGLVLFIEHLRKAHGDQAFDNCLPPMVDEYFAGAVFDKTDTVTRNFLMRSAFLPFMTSELAAQVTGNKHAGELLDHLHWGNCFTEKLVNDSDIYIYHSQFRKFLIGRAQLAIKQDELAEVRKLAAASLMATGSNRQAAELYVDAGDWEALSALVMENAQDLLAQGRSGLLRSWLLAMPTDFLMSNPSMMYWRGTCDQFVDPCLARSMFQSSYLKFEELGDRDGQLLSVSAIVDTGVACWEFRFLDTWIDAIANLLDERGKSSGSAIEVRATTALFIALMFREADYERIAPWCERIKQLIYACNNCEQRLAMGSYLLIYKCWLGHLQESAVLLGVLRPDRLEDISPAVRLQWGIAEACYAWFTSNWEHCNRMVELCVNTASACGSSVLDSVVLAQGIYGSLSSGDMPRGRTYLDKMKATVQISPLYRSHYYYLEGWYQALAGKITDALRQLFVALELAEKEGCPLPIAASHVEIAGLLLEQGKLLQAEKHLQLAETSTSSMRSIVLEIKCLFARARLACKQNRPEDMIRAVQQAFSLSRAEGISNFPWWYPPAMSAICVKALETGIEPNYVQELVRTRGLVPDTPPVLLETWPWAIKIYSLGRFAVTRDGQSLQIGGKGQRMPLMLLKVLIALGGRDVPESKVCETLWSGAEPDSAHSTFTTTLLRLRKLLGVPDLLQMGHGRLSLNSRCCWVDAWSFERAVREIAANWVVLSNIGDNAVQRAERALDLYNGSFLPDEDDSEYAIISTRKRLREKHVHLVERLGEIYVAQNKHAEALACFERGLEVDDLVEEFYRDLMACHFRLGNFVTALQIYERCRDVLTAHFGAGPSPRTRALHFSIRAGMS
jgi:DNA-binding SARP family transcriptional activator